VGAASVVTRPMQPTGGGTSRPGSCPHALSRGNETRRVGGGTLTGICGFQPTESHDFPHPEARGGRQAVGRRSRRAPPLNTGTVPVATARSARESPDHRRDARVAVARSVHAPAAVRARKKSCPQPRPALSGSRETRLAGIRSHRQKGRPAWVGPMSRVWLRLLLVGRCW
jgi:hypothetical protein